jgi:hypothetical protein
MVLPHISFVRSAGFRSHATLPQRRPLQSKASMATLSLTTQAPSGVAA